MKIAFKWILGVSISVVLLLALIGYLAGPEKSEAKTKPVEEVQADRVRDDLDTALKSSKLSLCEVYHWIESMESQTRHELEAKQPRLSPIELNDKLTLMRDEQWKAYCSQQHLPDSIRVYVNGYGIEECK